MPHWQDKLFINLARSADDAVLAADVDVPRLRLLVDREEPAADDAGENGRAFETREDFGNRGYEVDFRETGYSVAPKAIGTGIHQHVVRVKQRIACALLNCRIAGLHRVSPKAGSSSNAGLSPRLSITACVIWGFDSSALFRHFTA
jgi:hypothetical protein